MGTKKREKSFNASIVSLTCCEKNGSMKMDFNIALYARRGEKLTRRKTQENLKLNFHSQFRLSKRHLNMICCILNNRIIVHTQAHDFFRTIRDKHLFLLCFFNYFPFPFILRIHKNTILSWKKFAMHIVITQL